MPSEQRINYPDVLGAVTSDRVAVSVVQAAVGIRPKVARAGKPFSVLILLQNAANSAVDAVLTIRLPESDFKRQRGKFTAKAQRLVIGLQPAEVGYAVLPVLTAPDTAPGRDYKIGVELSVRPLSKTERVRAVEGGTPLDLTSLRGESLSEIEALQKLNFIAPKANIMRGGLMELPFSLLMGDADQPADDLKPQWVSLWTLKDYRSDDDFSLMRKHGEDLRPQLAKLRHDLIYKGFLDKTNKRFSEAGYPLNELEATLITRLLVYVLQYSVLEMAADVELNFYRADWLNLIKLYESGAFKEAGALPVLPNWTMGLLKAIESDKRSLVYPDRAIAYFAYDDLIRDAVQLGLRMLEDATGNELGTPEEMEMYADQVVDALNKRTDIAFDLVYLPLVMAGMLAFDRVRQPKDDIKKFAEGMRELVKLHDKERTEDNEAVFDMLKFMVQTVLLKYGFAVDI